MDDIAISVASWTNRGDTAADVTSLTLTNDPGTYYHRVAGLFARGGSQPIVGPWSNVVDMTVTEPPNLADLAVSQTDSPDPARVGQNLTYTITVTNNGPKAATGVTLTDTLPKNAGFGSSSTTQGTCSQKPSRGKITCSLGTMTSGQTVTVTVVVKPTAKGTITNAVSVQATSPPDPNSSNNTSSETTQVK